MAIKKTKELKFNIKKERKPGSTVVKMGERGTPKPSTYKESYSEQIQRLYGKKTGVGEWTGGEADVRRADIAADRGERVKPSQLIRAVTSVQTTKGITEAKAALARWGFTPEDFKQLEQAERERTVKATEKPLSDKGVSTIFPEDKVTPQVKEPLAEITPQITQGEPYEGFEPDKPFGDKVAEWGLAPGVAIGNLVGQGYSLVTGKKYVHQTPEELAKTKELKILGIAQFASVMATAVIVATELAALGLAMEASRRAAGGTSQILGKLGQQPQSFYDPGIAKTSTLSLNTVKDRIISTTVNAAVGGGPGSKVVTGAIIGSIGLWGLGLWGGAEGIDGYNFAKIQLLTAGANEEALAMGEKTKEAMAPNIWEKLSWVVAPKAAWDGIMLKLDGARELDKATDITAQMYLEGSDKWAIKDQLEKNYQQAIDAGFDAKRMFKGVYDKLHGWEITDPSRLTSEQKVWLQIYRGEQTGDLAKLPW